MLAASRFVFKLTSDILVHRLQPQLPAVVSVRGLKRGRKKTKGLADFDPTPALSEIRGVPGGVTRRKSAKLLGWDDYQYVKFKCEGLGRQNTRMKKNQLFRLRMNYAENLINLGMSNFAIERITDLHPFVIDYVRRRLSGNIECVRKGVWFRGSTEPKSLI